MNVRAIVLASGLGSRLRPHTDAMSKQMLPLLGKPLVEHTVDSMKRSGIEDITLATFAHHDQMANHFKDDPQISISHNTTLMGTAYCLRSAGTPEAPVLICYGDLVLSKDFPWQALFKSHQEQDADVSIVYKNVPDARRMGVLDLDGEKVTGLREKPFINEAVPVPGAMNAAIYVLSPRAVKTSQGLLVEEEDTENTKNDFMRNIFPALLTKGHRIHGFNMGTSYWKSVDTQQDYQQVFVDYVRGNLELRTGSGMLGLSELLEGINTDSLISAI